MLNSSMGLELLHAAYAKARDMAELMGNHGKKIRLALEGLLREGVLVSGDRCALVFADQVAAARYACEDVLSMQLEKSAFGLDIAVEDVDLESRSMRIKLGILTEPTSMRERLRLLTEIAERLDHVHRTLGYMAPSDRLGVLIGVVTEELSDEARDAEIDRLTVAFDRLRLGNYADLEDLTIPLKVIDLASILNPDIDSAFEAARAKSIARARDEAAWGELPFEQPSPLSNVLRKAI